MILHNEPAFDIFYKFIFVLLYLGIFHTCFLFLNLFSNIKLRNKTIWFFLHFIGNMLVVICSIPYIYMFLSNLPYHLQYPVYQYDTTIIAVAIHIYHILFFNLNYDDIFHHFYFVFIGLIIQYLHNLGYLLALYHFFVTGFPGGIDYLILFLVDIGIYTKQKRLRIASFLNIWIRSPGILFSFAFCIVIFSYNQLNFINCLYLLIDSFVCYYNAQLYLKLIVEKNAIVNNQYHRLY